MQQHQGCQAQCEAGLTVLSMTNMPEDKKKEFSSPCSVPGYSDIADDTVAVHHVPRPFPSERSHVQ